MKFTIKTTLQEAPRLGEISQIKGKPHITLETPLALLHTQGGQVPHLTHEVLKLVTKEPQILQIPIVGMHNYRKAIKLFEGPLAEFIGSKDSLTCMTLHDPSNFIKQGHHIKDKVPVFTKNGKVMYDSDKYMDMIEEFQPDMYTFLCDGDTNISSSNKRINKAVESTVVINRHCLERHKMSSVLKDAFVVASIAGGYCLKARQKCIELLIPNGAYFQGYLIDGLHNSAAKVELIKFTDIKPVVDGVIEKLPVEKLRMVQGCWSPVNILQLVNSGVDVFDTSYCQIVAERNGAIIFSIDDHETSEACEINLKHNQFAEDFQPLLTGCLCLACQGYSRAYIHHLLTVQELLGPVLLMVHNVHHMLRFFQKIRDSIRDGQFDELKARISDQFELCQSKREYCEVDVSVS